MARSEGDREDLMEEATALVRRAELRAVGFAEPIVTGFRRDGGLSVYFGADPAYHLDPVGRLKRAYRDGRLFRTQGDTLAELMRERTATETVLRRRDLTGPECGAFVDEMRELLGRLCLQVDRGEATVLRQVPSEDPALISGLADALRRVSRLEESSAPHLAGLAPRFKGKR